MRAVARAISDGAFGCLARVEDASAGLACRSAAGITELSGAGAWLEGFSADTAFALRSAVREAETGEQVGVLLPEESIGLAVTRRAKGDEVFDHIGFAVMVEEAEGSHVMHRERLALNAAMLTPMPISLPGLGALCRPVLTAIALVAASPGGIVRAAPVRRCTPYLEAFTAAKVVVGNCAGGPAHCGAAGVTGNTDANATNTNAVGPLPETVALEPTKGVCGHFGVVGLAFDGCPALSAVHCIHTYIIPFMGDNYRRTLCLN